MERCIICGFNKKVHLHHLQKFLEYGSNDSNNLVYLCPNHHWIADFGKEEDRIKLLNKIKDITNKQPLIDYNKKNYYEKLIRILLEHQFGKLTDVKYEEMFPYNSWNREFYRKIFCSRPGSFEYDTQRVKITKKAEILYLIDLLNQQLDDLPERMKN